MEKDYRSLEKKIRDMYEAGPGTKRLMAAMHKADPGAEERIKKAKEAMQKDMQKIDPSYKPPAETKEEVEQVDEKTNTEIRMDEPNVGRPDTAKNPMDPKSKLSKQAEIKTKIIDEDKMKHNFGLPNSLINTVKSIVEKSVVDPKKMTGGKTEVDLKPTTDDKTEDTTAETQKARETASKENKKIGQKGAGPVDEALQRKIPEWEATTEKQRKQIVKSENKQHNDRVAGQFQEEIAEEKKQHTTPKTEKEKKLAALAEPKDKITHKDILVGRGAFVEQSVNEVRGVAPQAVDKHNCATHVFHEQFGEGKPLFSQHAEPDGHGNIEWYDVMFEHGIEKRVLVSEMKIVASESHMNHPMKKKKKMKEEVESVEEAAHSMGGGKKREGMETSEPKHSENIMSAASKAMGGSDVSFKHKDGSTSTITPSMGRKISSKLGSAPHREKADMVQAMHKSSDHLKKAIGEQVLSAEELERIEQIAKDINK